MFLPEVQLLPEHVSNKCIWCQDLGIAGSLLWFAAHQFGIRQYLIQRLESAVTSGSRIGLKEFLHKCSLSAQSD